MPKIICRFFLTAFFIIGALPGLAFAGQIEPYIQLGQGTRDFSWAIAGPRGIPDIQSELSWKDLRSRQVSTGVEGAYRGFITSLRADFGQIESGTVRDSDYLENSRSNESFRSVSDASDSTFRRWLLLIGPQIGMQGEIVLLPQIGYMRADETYRLRGGTQLIPESEPIDGLDSSYKTQAKGFGGGMSLHLFPQKWVDRLGMGWHRFALQYVADADWNLRVNEPDPEDRFRYFKHRGTGVWTLFWLEGEWRATGRLSLFARWEKSELKVENGLDTTYYLDGRITEQSLRSVVSGEETWLVGAKGRF